MVIAAIRSKQLNLDNKKIDLTVWVGVIFINQIKQIFFDSGLILYIVLK